MADLKTRPLCGFLARPSLSVTCFVLGLRQDLIMYACHCNSTSQEQTASEHVYDRGRGRGRGRLHHDESEH